MCRMGGKRIIPGNVFLDSSLNELISELCAQADKEAVRQNGAICQQQLYVSVVPVRYLECTSGQKEFHVVVYDYDRKVICDDFPSVFGSLFSRPNPSRPPF